MQMPGKDGYQTIQEYRSWEKEQNLPRKLVVSLSAFAIQDEIQSRWMLVAITILQNHSS